MSVQMIVGALIGLALIYPAVWVMSRFGGPYAHGNIRPKLPFMVADQTPIKARVRIRKIPQSSSLLYDAAEDALAAFKLLVAGLSHDRNVVDMIKPHIDQLETALAKAAADTSVLSGSDS